VARGRWAGFVVRGSEFGVVKARAACRLYLVACGWQPGAKPRARKPDLVEVVADEADRAAQDEEGVREAGLNRLADLGDH
jgi:hypothetical protein